MISGLVLAIAMTSNVSAQVAATERPAEAIDVASWPALKEQQRQAFDRAEDQYRTGKFADAAVGLAESWRLVARFDGEIQRTFLAANVGITRRQAFGEIGPDEAESLKTKLSALRDTEEYFLYGAALDAVLQDAFRETGDDPTRVIGVDPVRKMTDRQYAYLVGLRHVDTKALGAEKDLGVLPLHFDGEFR